MDQRKTKEVVVEVGNLDSEVHCMGAHLVHGDLSQR